MRTLITSILLLVASVVFGQDQFGDLTDINIWVKYTDPLSIGLIGWWPMNEGSGVTINDVSTSGNVGYLTNAVWVTPGRPGQAKALSFTNAQSAYVNVADSATFPSPWGAGTVSFWVNLPLPTTSYGLVCKGNPISGSGFNSLGGYATSSTFYGTVLGSASQYNALSIVIGAVPVNTWFFVTYVWDAVAQVRSMYTNGVVATSFSSSVYTPTPAGLPWRFGCGSTGTGPAIGTPANFATCIMNDVRVYNRALNAGEVATLYTR